MGPRICPYLDKEEPRSSDGRGGDPDMLISQQIQEEMTKSLFMEKLRLACKNQVPGHFPMDTQNGDMDHTKPLGGFGGLEKELK